MVAQTFDYGVYGGSLTSTNPRGKTAAPFLEPATSLGEIALYPVTLFSQPPQDGSWDHVLVY